MEEPKQENIFLISFSHEEMGWSFLLPLYAVPFFLALLVTACPAFHLSVVFQHVLGGLFCSLVQSFLDAISLSPSGCSFFNSPPPPLLLQFCPPLFCILMLFHLYTSSKYLGFLCEPKKIIWVSPDFLMEPPLPEATLAPTSARYSQMFLNNSGCHWVCTLVPRCKVTYVLRIV